MDKRRIEDEAGITLVEILVSIVILGIVLTAFFGALSGNLQSLSDSRARQEASFQTQQVLETLRELPAAAAAMATSYDPTLVSCGGSPGQVDIYGDGSLCEPLLIDPLLDADRITDAAPWAGSSNNIDYATYATTVAGSDTVRVTVVVDYELASGPKSIRRSTLVSEVNRG